MANPKIVHLNKTRIQCENHIDYLRRKKNIQTSPPIGNAFRDYTIIPRIEEEIKENGYSHTSETFHNSEEDPEELQEFVTESPTLSPSEQEIHEIDKDLIEESVVSSFINSSTDYENQREVIKDRVETRNRRIRENVMKKNEAIDEIRNQKNELLKGKERRDMILSILLQIQQKGQQQSNMIMHQIQQQQAFTNMLLMKIFNLKPETQTERTYQEQRSEVREE
jgi:hypothetical protein